MNRAVYERRWREEENEMIIILRLWEWELRESTEYKGVASSLFNHVNL